MVLLLVVIVFIALHLVTVPDVAYVPGEALAVNGPQGAVTVSGKHVGAADIYLVTIAEQSRVTE